MNPLFPLVAERAGPVEKLLPDRWQAFHEANAILELDRAN
jgi:hypothetical protein